MAALNDPIEDDKPIDEQAGKIGWGDLMGWLFLVGIFNCFDIIDAIFSSNI